ncbi:kremen protein 2 isoform X4 [Macaca fascicularis]|uniref:kremen protein 2 isoform X4 n=1 Tax=Macaca fascicularis TaxID=9541 RepID=UPI0032B0416C
MLCGLRGTPSPQRPQRHLHEAHGPGVPSLLPHEGVPGTAHGPRPVTPDLDLKTPLNSYHSVAKPRHRFLNLQPDSHPDPRPHHFTPTPAPALGSPRLCSQLAGVEAGYACFCGSESDLARGRLAPATDCDQICFGHPGQLCGGDGRLGVYEVSVGSCQGNWTAPQGVIYSPDFPDEYGPDRNCSWALGPPGAALELTFRLFELADPRDRLELRDAASGSLLRAFDGARPPPPGPLRLGTAALLLTFRSDARGHAQGFALTYRGLQDAAEDPAAPEGSAQTPAAPLDGANVSCSPRPGAPQAAMGARVFSTVTAVSVLLLLLLGLLRPLRRRSCLLAPGKGSPALGPSRGPRRSWAVWYRQPRGVPLPCSPGDPQVEGSAAGYRPLSASSQSSLRSLISAL